MIKNLNHVCLIVKDLDRSIRFYRDVMGLRVSKVTGIEGKYPQKVLGVKGVKIYYAKLSVPDRSERGRPVLELHCWQRPRILPKKSYGHISFGVKDIDGEYRRLRRKGVRFISKPLTAPDGHARICFGCDLDGNRIEFIEIMGRVKKGLLKNAGYTAKAQNNRKSAIAKAQNAFFAVF